MKIKLLSRLLAVTVLTMAISFALTASTVAQQPGNTPGNGAPFTGIFAFGDSLSDTGNLFELTGGFPPPPYFEGRVSNGIVWIEYLANAMGLDSESIVNYAVAGATTGRDNENDGLLFNGMVFEDLPGLQDELDFFESDLNGKKADKRALYVVWAGANDFFVSGPSFDTVVTGVENTVVAVQRLYQAGARRIMVVNLPDLGLTPFGRSVDPEGLSFLSSLYNGSLDSALDALEAGGIGTIRVDSAAVLQDIVDNPADFGFSNVENAFLLTGGDPSEFLFWDMVHPTTNGHFFIAEEAMSVLLENFRHVWVTPRRGR
jgi:phospholipase/lecithinase/hemolysin